MKFYKQIIAATLVLGLASCGTIKKNTVKESDVQGPTVIQKPVVADLEVKETKVTGTYSDRSKKTMKFVKEMALYDALQKANADVLIEARYVTVKKFGRIEVTVTGYPATYKNFRAMELKDTLFVKTTGSFGW